IQYDVKALWEVIRPFSHRADYWIAQHDGLIDWQVEIPQMPKEVWDNLPEGLKKMAQTPPEEIPMSFFASPTRLIAPALAVVTAVALAGGAAARPGGGGGEGCGPRGGGKLDRIERSVERLDLDEETRSSVYSVLDASRDEDRELRREMREAREQMRSLMDAEQPDTEAIFAQADAIGALRTEAQKQKLRTMIELRQLLSPEQWRELRSFRDGRGRGFGPRGAGREPRL
ncbi:MAG: Spy/CpxP family protein refolding chaperone, partial [Proteobacteria bacterium]|nr:Spy/CpxP family protein refolding chaperone [Pseudomonadota bacterium]